MSIMQHNKTSREVATTNMISSDAKTIWTANRREDIIPQERTSKITTNTVSSHKFEDDCAHESAISCRIKPEISKNTYSTSVQEFSETL
jgi:translation elongation factor EF-Tu-like GTPase